MPVKNDLGIFLLFLCQSSVMVCVQKFQNPVVGFFSVITFKGLHIHARGVLLAQTRGELNLAVDRIIVLDEPADKPDDDCPRLREFLVRKDRVRRTCLAKDESGDKEKDIKANRRKLPEERNCVNHTR